MLDLTVLGISLQGENSMPILLLHPCGTDQILRLGIGPTEAFAISSVLNAPESGEEKETDPAQKISLPQESPPEEKNPFPRPMTHDLTLALVHALGGKMLGVELLRMEEGVFTAEAVIAANAAILRIDCRPSDGVALALRCGALIRATDAVLAHAEKAAEVLPSLPDHLRILIRARMAASAGRGERSRTEGGYPPSAWEPLRVQEPEKEPDANPAPAPHRSRPLRIRAMPAPLREKVPDPAALKQSGKDAGTDLTAIPSKHLGNIRISLVRQNLAGNLEIVDEFCLPAKGAPQAVPQPDPLAGAEQILKNGGAEEEQWTALLKALSPETKLPM